MSFRLDTPYYPIPGQEPQATFGAVMEMLLKARLKLHFDTHRQLYDEDVNTYLAGILVSYIDPVYLQEIARVLSQSDIDIYHSIEKAQDRVEVYRIYKVNADDLLISLGLFRPFWMESQEELERLKRYYACACEVQRRIYGKRTAVSEIQSKLSERSERYLTILSCTRKEYLHLMEQVQAEDLSKEIRRFEEELKVALRQDEFLDACSAWLKGQRSPELKVRLALLSQELSQLIPGFQPPSFLQEIF